MSGSLTYNENRIISGGAYETTLLIFDVFGCQ